MKTTITVVSTSATQKRLRQLRDRLRRGQAMVEYSVISHFMLGFGGAALLFFISKLFTAMSGFFRGVFMVLETGAL